MSRRSGRSDLADIRDPTEVSFGRVPVTGGATHELDLGAVDFDIADTPSRMPAEGLSITSGDLLEFDTGL